MRSRTLIFVLLFISFLLPDLSAAEVTGVIKPGLKPGDILIYHLQHGRETGQMKWIVQDPGNTGAILAIAASSGKVGEVRFDRQWHLKKHESGWGVLSSKGEVLPLFPPGFSSAPALSFKSTTASENDSTASVVREEEVLLGKTMFTCAVVEVRYAERPTELFRFYVNQEFGIIKSEKYWSEDLAETMLLDRVIISGKERAFGVKEIPPTESSSYLPLSVGNLWQYSGVVYGKNGSETFEIIRQESGGVFVVSRIDTTRKRRIRQLWVKRDGNLLNLFPRDRKKFVVILKLAPVAGNTWKVTPGDNESDLFKVLAPKTISTPAGVFSAIEVQVARPDGTVYTRIYYAKGVGMVRITRVSKIWRPLRSGSEEMEQVEVETDLSLQYARIGAKTLGAREPVREQRP